MAEPTMKQRLQILHAQLQTERSSFEPHWRDLSDHILPRRARFTVSETNRGEKRNQKIIDSAATFAAGVLRAGMMSGVTSPARLWFRLGTPDPALAEVESVKAWLHLVTQRMSSIFTRSNLYNALPILYGDLGVFGTAAMAVMEDDEDVIRCYPFPIGSYWLANDSRNRVRTFFREYRMTVRQVVERFATPGATGTPDWSRFSTHVRSQWQNGAYETPVDVCWAIVPNPKADPAKLLAKHKPFLSVYYEKGTSESVFLEESGFDEFPVLAPRWEVTGEDAYGTNSPGMIALGDIKQLQLGERRGAQALDKIVNPPLIGPPGMKALPISQLPGAVSYAQESQHGALRPIHEVRLSLQDLEFKQDQVRSRIRRAFFEDLFLMLAQSDRRQITAREIDERHEEKLLALGPVLEQLNQDLLNPLIDRAFAIMVRRGLVPPAPEELQGVALRVEYISITAQAQKMIGLAGLERFTRFALDLAAVDPSVLDKVDRDQLVDEYGDMTGVPPRVIVPDEQAAATRDARAQAAAAAEQAQLAQTEAATAKTLADTNTEQPSALRDLLAAVGGGAAMGTGFGGTL